MSKSLSILVLAAWAGTAMALASGDSMKRLVFGKDIQATPVDRASGPASVSLPDLQVVVNPKTRYKSPYLIATGALQNPSADPVRIEFYRFGPFILAMPEDDINVEEIHSLGRSIGDGGMPKLSEFTLPAHSTVEFTARMDLANYAYKGTPKVKLHWTFFLAASQPQGDLNVRLPKRSAGGSHFYVEGEAVSKRTFNKRLKSLQGQEGWYCKMKTGGGETGWVARDIDGSRFKIKFDTTEKGYWSEIYKLE